MRKNKYRKGDRLRIIVAEHIRAGGELRDGDEVEVIARNKETGGIRVKHICGEQEFYLFSEELEYVQRIYKRPSKKRRIEKLEIEVAELQRLLEESGMKKPRKGISHWMRGRN